ncbi:MAG TPA: penicillin-binding protein [Vicinamibacterales bacterium]|nr:penicillin-binding protein [Vicinamibacterales bacterium]
MSVRDRLAALAQLLPAGVRPAEASLAPELEADREWRRIVKARLLVAVIGVTCWTAVIEARLFWYQVVQHDALEQRAARQQQDEVLAPARRGEILDRNGNVLAFSVDADSLVAVPYEVTEPEATAHAVCAVLECSADEHAVILRRLKGRGAFAYLRRLNVSPDEARRIAELDLPGINFIQETKRYYPKLHLASHVLGFVGIDNNGLGGVEQAYDTLIKGRDGKIRMQVDARQHAVQSRVELEPTAGATLELTIDQYIQNIAERELKRGVDETRAAGGTAIVMDPRTGEILALANYPTFNPNVYNRVPADTRRNRAIQEIYEPGSTFKIVTASAAIEEGVLSPSDPIDCAPGHITIGGWRTVRDLRTYGVLSFEDVIVKSSNVGAIKAGLQLGPDRLHRYVDRFGFGQALAPDFRGQSRGIVWPAARMDDNAIASVSMGYQIGVTPLQMATAVSAVANGGRLLEPHLVRAMIRDGVRHPVSPKVLRQAIAPSTASTLTTIMESVVERGTAKAASVDGYRVAGKTGTAAKTLEWGRGYSKSDYNGSFVGFVPSRKPALTILVVIDSGRTGQGFGGAVAAPVFKRIAEASLRHLGVPRTIDPIPPIFASLPPADAAPAAARTSILASLTPAANLGLMPDLRGLGAREALRVLGRLGVSARMEGSGIVVDQQPEAGTPLERGGWSLLRLGRDRGDGLR